MAFLAGRTIAVRAREGEVVVAVGFELARLAPAADERSTTVGTGWTVGRFSLPVGGLTLKRQILEHAGAHAIPALVQRLLNFR